MRNPHSGGGPTDVETAYATGAFSSTGAARDAALAALHARLLRIAGKSCTAGPDAIRSRARNWTIWPTRPPTTRCWRSRQAGSVPRRESVHDVGLPVRHPGGLGQARQALLATSCRCARRAELGTTAGPFRAEPEEFAFRNDLIAAVRRAVEEDLTERQRQVFVAIAVNGIPLDALVDQLGSNRNALYKTMFDARRKLRSVLAAHGYLTAEQADQRTSTRVRRS